MKSKQEEVTPSGEQPKFTRRPWLTKWNGAYGHMVFGSDGSGSAVAVVSGVAPGITTTQGKANARLIAAAPALYEALNYVSEVSESISTRDADDSDTASITVTVGWLREVKDALALVDAPQETK